MFCSYDINVSSVHRWVSCLQNVTWSQSHVIRQAARTCPQHTTWRSRCRLIGDRWLPVPYRQSTRSTMISVWAQKAHRGTRFWRPLRVSINTTKYYNVHTHSPAKRSLFFTQLRIAGLRQFKPVGTRFLWRPHLLTGPTCGLIFLKMHKLRTQTKQQS